jgi:hypothetical protein
LISRTSIGIVTTAILVLVSLVAVGDGVLDDPLRQAVHSYFFAAALGGGGILFDALVDSIFVDDAPTLRVIWSNRLASTGSAFWLAGAVLTWLNGSAALAEHYGLGHTEQLWLLCFLLAPLALGMVIALVNSVLVSISCHSAGSKPRSKRASRAQR